MKKSRSIQKVLFLITLLIAFLFNLISCHNLFEDDVEEDDQPSVEVAVAPAPVLPGNSGGTSTSTAPALEVITSVSFGGKLRVSGAVPSSVNEALEAIQGTETDAQTAATTNRTATASLPDGTAYEYFVKAYTQDADNLSHEETPVVSGTGEIEYQLSLELGHLWYFQAGFRKKATGTQGQDDYVAAKTLMQDIETASPDTESFSYELTEANAGVTHDFILQPLQTAGGHGGLELQITSIPTGVDAVELYVTGDNGVPVRWMEDKVYVTMTGGPTYIRSMDAGNPSSNIPSGAYEVLLNFYKTDTSLTPSKYLVYQTIQTINIFDDMVTNTWIRETDSSAVSGDEVISTDGVFSLTAAHITRFINTTLYVGQPEGVQVAPSDSNVGTAFSPLLTLQRAINIIKASGQGSAYRIYVSGTQHGCTTIPNTITTSKASKIEIIGLGNTRAVLTRPEVYSGGSILSIADGSENNLSPIILKNIQITGGQASEGAGICIGTYGSVTLGAGALVGTEGTGLVTADNCGNMAYAESGPSPFGAGISCYGDLIMKKGSKVCRNYSASSTGGIYCVFGSVTIEHGAEVSDNRAFGSTGGIAINSGNLTMNGGSISGNIAGGDNGGLCITGSTTNPSLVTISGNSVISGNIAGLGKGGAVCVYNNTTFKISGSASIPYGVGTPAEYGPGKNDVYLAAGAVVTAGVLSGTGTVATITPYSWTRGLVVLKPDTSAISGITENIKNRFALTNDSFEFFIKTDAVNGDYGIINAPYYVSGGTAGGAQVCVDSEGNAYTPGHEAGRTGAKDQPFDSLGDVFQVLNDANTDFIIKIDGRVRNIQGDTVNVIAAKSITIEGASADNTHDILDNSLDTGSVLKVDGGKTVIIKNLKITGGSGSTGGGGITVANGSTVKLDSGTWITGNSSSGSGGGVYVDTNGILFMYGSAAIGDKDGSGGRPTGSNLSTNQCANTALNGAGIFNFGGKVYLGYKGYAADNTTPVEETLTGGIYRNYSTDSGGFTGYGSGITNVGTLLIASGNICNNVAEIGGGGLLNYTGGTCTITGATFTGNGVGSNCAGKGGAIYNQAVLNINGTVNIPGGTGNAASPLNDIKVDNGKYLTLGSNFNVTNGTTIKLSPEEVENVSFKKRNVLTGDALTGNNTTDAAVYEKFTLNARGFKLASNTVSGTNYGMLTFKHIVKTIYVASVENNDTTRTGPAGKSMEGNPTVLDTTWQSAPLNGSTYCFNDNGTTDVNSNSTYPFTGIEKALQFITYQETTVDENGTAFDYTIMIDGRVKVNTIIGDYPNANYPQRLAATASDDGPATVTKIILKSRNTGTSDTAPKDLLDAAGKDQPCLIIQTAVPVQIEDIGITGGNNTENMGGGIKIASGSKVTLCGKTQVYGNQAATGGGGIENCGTLLIYGKVVIGKAGALAAPASYPALDAEGLNRTDSGNGGGIYNNGGKLYLGYSDTDSDHAAEWSGAIIHNYAFNSGGGIYSTGDNSAIYFAHGSITYNLAKNSNGGGVYTESPVFMWGDAVIGTKRDSNAVASSYPSASSNGGGENGGGIYCTGSNAKLYLGCKSLDFTDPLNPVPVEDSDFSGGIFWNYASHNGGGVYCGAAASVEMYDGVISLNYSSSDGGGVCIDTDTSSMIMHEGTISRNGAGSNGGGVYSAGNFTMNGDSVIGDSSKTEAASSESNCSNYAYNGGGICFAPNGTSVERNLNSGVIAYNYASTCGGGLLMKQVSPASGAVNIKNSINYNGAGNSGGGIYAYAYEAGPAINYNLEDTKITGNTITSGSGKGGAIYVRNHNAVLSMKGDVSIPCTGVRENDIFLNKETSIPKVQIAGEIGGKGAIATITLNSTDYTESPRTYIIDKTGEATNAILAKAAIRFRLTPKPGTPAEPWCIGTNGSISPTQAASSFTSEPSAQDTIGVFAQEDFAKIKEWVSDGKTLTTNTILLESDITIDSSWTSGIGNSTTQFKGTFDGKNNTITFNNSTGPIFGETRGAYIENINFAGTAKCSPLANKITGTTIKNCVSNCNVNSTQQYVSGFVAEASGSTEDNTNYTSDCFVIDCVNNGSVSGGKYTGGIVSSSNACIIINCEQNGNVMSGSKAGGIVAECWEKNENNKSGYIENCCVTGEISSDGTKGVGGNAGYALIGGIYGGSTTGTPVIFNSCFAGRLTTTVSDSSKIVMGGIQAISVRADFDNLFYVNTDTERSYGTSDYAYSGVTKVVGDITNEEIAKLNAPETYLTSSYKDYASTNLYRKWTLDADNKPKLIR